MLCLSCYEDLGHAGGILSPGWPERLGSPQNELENVAGEREIWVSLLGLLPDPGISG